MLFLCANPHNNILISLASSFSLSTAFQHIRSQQKRQRLTMFVRLLRLKPTCDATIAEGVTSAQSAYNGTEVG